MSISPTFLEQLLYWYSCTKKSTNLESKYKKAGHETFVQKSFAKNVGEIDSWGKKLLIKFEQNIETLHPIIILHTTRL